MRRQIGLLGLVGFFGLVTAAAAQPPSASTAGTQFDGTYQLVSSARVNKTYVTRGAGRHHMGTTVMTKNRDRRNWYTRIPLQALIGYVDPVNDPA